MRDFNAEAAALPKHNFDLIQHHYMMRAFRPWFAGLDALELGCFHGDFTRLICERFPYVTVIEGSEECIAVAKERAPTAKFIHSRFEDARIKMADAIFLIHTLEHLDDPQFVLRRCREWLSPQGRLFVAVPNAYAASRQIAVKMGLIEYPTAVTEAERAHGHRRTYSLDGLHREARDAGLIVHERGGVMFKGMSNGQMDRALDAGIIDRNYLDGCYALGQEFPDLCASVFVVCGR